MNIANFRNLIGLTHRLSCLADFSAKGLSKGSYVVLYGGCINLSRGNPGLGENWTILKNWMEHEMGTIKLECMKNVPYI